jgi:hypothetical protein
LLAVGGFAKRILRAPLTARAPLQSENCEAAGEVFLASIIRRPTQRASSDKHSSARSQRHDATMIVSIERTRLEKSWLAEPKQA